VADHEHWNAALPQERDERSACLGPQLRIENDAIGPGSLEDTVGVCCRIDRSKNNRAVSREHRGDVAGCHVAVLDDEDLLSGQVLLCHLRDSPSSKHTHTIPILYTGVTSSVPPGRLPGLKLP